VLFEAWVDPNLTRQAEVRIITDQGISGYGEAESAKP
jgi:L-alanine-DL-glutamate epimerase-like enolase superfamily enzyme